MGRSNLLASMQSWARAREFADVYLTPDTHPYGFASFDKVEALAELGYRSTARQLAETDLSSVLPSR